MTKQRDDWLATVRPRLTRWADWQHSISGGVGGSVVVDLSAVDGVECEIELDAQLMEIEKILGSIKINPHTEIIYRVVSTEYLNPNEGGRMLADRLGITHSRYRSLLRDGEAMVYSALKFNETRDSLTKAA